MDSEERRGTAFISDDKGHGKNCPECGYLGDMKAERLTEQSHRFKAWNFKCPKCGNEICLIDEPEEMGNRGGE